MTNISKIALFALALLVSEAVAQKQAVPGDSLSASPTPETERAKLSFLVGYFATESAIKAMPGAPNGSTGKGTSVIAWGLDGKFLLIDEQNINSISGQCKGHGVLGFDPTIGQFVLSMFNNYGDHPSYKGNFAGDTLMLKTTVPMPGHPFDQELLWYKDGESVKLKVLNDSGKGFVPILEQTATPASPVIKK